MNCKQVVQQLSDYLDGELTPALRHELSQHLCECKDCELVVNQTKLTVEIYCDAEMVDLPQQVRTRLHQALRRKLASPNQ